MVCAINLTKIFVTVMWSYDLCNPLVEALVMPQLHLTASNFWDTEGVQEKWGFLKMNNYLELWNLRYCQFVFDIIISLWRILEALSDGVKDSLQGSQKVFQNDYFDKKSNFRGMGCGSSGVAQVVRPRQYIFFYKIQTPRPILSGR